MYFKAGLRKRNIFVEAMSFLALNSQDCGKLDVELLCLTEEMTC
jgi:hypothetical protein